MTETFAVEHIIPISRGGTNDLDNLAYACSGCNGHKYNRIAALDLVENQFVPLFHPRRDRWQEHFCWSDDYTCVIGLTPTGRATVEALQLNRPGVVKMREVLYAVGKHPPNVAS